MKAPTPITGGPFAILERDLAQQLGLSLDQLAETRKASLKHGVAWKLVSGSVCYSEAGQAQLFGLLKISSETPFSPAPAQPAVDSAPNAPAGLSAGDVRELVCVRRYSINFRILVAKLDGKEQRVRVRDSRNFTAGMKLQCRFVQDDLWDLAQRLPRWRGRF